MVGELGQRCPDCGGPMELNENVSIDGTPMYSLCCRTHGRHTEWYLEREYALVAPVIRRRTSHSPPIAGLPPEPAPREVVTQSKNPIPGQSKIARRRGEPSGKQIIEAAMDADGRSDA